MTLIICMFLVGAALVIAEVMFPSFGILGLLSATAFLIAVIKSFEMGDTPGYLAIGGVLVVVPLALGAGIQLLKHSPLGNRLLLKGPSHDEVSGAGADRDLSRHVGREGVTKSTLRPSGIVEIDGERVDAVSTGAFIAPDTRVKFTYVEGNRAVVEPVEPDV